ncbi:MAG: GNAT family N-acetyltransferase [Candidatus Bathyarchaeota archaeon]|nr:GNAT family N-acetyltransferase [Candidatus Bathyarchaeota archaeon]
MIRKLSSREFSAILDVVNNAAQVYKGVIPQDCWKEPYMPEKELAEEIESGVEFYGYFEGGMLLGVMGIQYVKDVILIRHAYVLAGHQRKGIGEKLLRYLLTLAGTQREILVGTWTTAWWALRFYEKHGFKLMPNESQSLLRQYWTIPQRQAETSVVLKLEKQTTHNTQS